MESKSYTDVETETGVDEEVPVVSSAFDEVLTSNPCDNEGIASVEMLATRKQQAAQGSNMTLPICIIITYFYLSLFSYLFVVVNMKPLFSSSGDLSIFTHSGNRITLSDVPAAVPADVDVGVNSNNESIIAPTTEESNECSGDTFEDALGVTPEDWSFPVSNRVSSNISEVGAATVRSNEHADLCYPAGPSSAICDPVSVKKLDLPLVEPLNRDGTDINAALITLASSALNLADSRSSQYMFMELHRELDDILRKLSTIEAMKLGVSILEQANEILEKNRSQQK
ncbi:uncharacterized protein LOC131435155 [Malaya genurostris]|uniref:uncharacterized protein LOC131435155 n=1 Tax=Malaya genurostris TaxID=325434 RepID=UPI0026F3CC6E|nr:uncharacterized protein LOC131435155 [Malaya genurostris]